MFWIWSHVMYALTRAASRKCKSKFILSSLLSEFPTQEVNFYIIIIISCSPDIRRVNGSLV